MKHRLLSSVVRSGVHEVDPSFYISWENTYQVLECQECDNVTLRVRHWNDEAQCSHNKKDYQDSYYPPIVSRQKPVWFDKLESKFQYVLEEVYIALDANTRFLAAFGARTALDMLIVDKIGDVGTFKEKLNKLESDGYIDPTEKELLDAVTEAGNAAAHRGYAPDEKLLNSVIDILESLFDRIYFKLNRDKELLKKARELKKKIPKRKK
jgi:predicted RNA-binding protein with RPS1 domain